MKKILLFLVALFCVVLLFAQTNENNKYFLPSNDKENFFNQATLVFEGNFERVVDTYDTKGNGNTDDIYSISEYKVEKVYKGDQSLVGNTILIVRKGGMLGEENFSWDGEFDDLQIRHGEVTISTFSPAIFFLVNSDYPDDENSKYFQEKKYGILDKVFAEGYYVASFNDLPFSNKVELHHWMKQFEGYAFLDWEPRDWKPGLNWVNGAEQGASVLESEYYKNLQIKMDSLNNETIIGIEKDVKKKNKKM